MEKLRPQFFMLCFSSFSIAVLLIFSVYVNTSIYMFGEGVLCIYIYIYIRKKQVYAIQERVQKVHRGGAVSQALVLRPYVVTPLFFHGVACEIYLFIFFCFQLSSEESLFKKKSHVFFPQIIPRGNSTKNIARPPNDFFFCLFSSEESWTNEKTSLCCLPRLDGLNPNPKPQTRSQKQQSIGSVENGPVRYRASTV